MRIHRFRWFAFASLKSQVPLNSERRDKLIQDRVVLEFRQFRDGGDAWEMEHAALDGRSLSPVDIRVYLHVGNPCLSPWGATFKLLTLAPEQSPQVPGEV